MVKDATPAGPLGDHAFYSDPHPWHGCLGENAVLVRRNVPFTLLNHSSVFPKLLYFV